MDYNVIMFILADCEMTSFTGQVNRERLPDLQRNANLQKMGGEEKTFNLGNNLMDDTDYKHLVLADTYFFYQTMCTYTFADIHNGTYLLTYSRYLFSKKN